MAKQHVSTIINGEPVEYLCEPQQTMLPSTMTVQAPQSPELQPSLLPVRFNSSRSTSSIVCCGSHRYSTGSPLMIVDTCCLAI